MIHTFTITLDGDQAKQPFTPLYNMGLLYGAEYFQLCNDHAKEYLGIKVERTLDIHASGSSCDYVNIVISHDDEDLLEDDEVHDHNHFPSSLEELFHAIDSLNDCPPPF